jgi:hypothetical protein
MRCKMEVPLSGQMNDLSTGTSYCLDGIVLRCEKREGHKLGPCRLVPYKLTNDPVEEE